MFEYLKKLIKTKKINLNISDDLLMKITSSTNGDFRSTINIIDILVNLYPKQKTKKQLNSF